ncbi:TRAF3-interacting protein 1-like isoform X2 [Stegodyphus dumicola]|uniref:TRAF3-interacting protein 1-like isoform X2 n=1 Tax=Stegodyphus dumicola TaxID=202533 RepID=UPI0015AED8C5|nr:TRAF3-interacting protein 1-like isoform X2 [Stegodyphus dumicola]
MAEEIDTSVIKKTQEILGSVIKKPALTEKSLKKPPFRFLHDIITNVIKTSGFYKGLYTSEELQSDNVKDKETKIVFLQKAIDVLALVTSQPINLKPSKVVAGHDPQKTNVFLQILGTAVKNKLDSKEAVEKVLNEKIQGSPTKVPKERRMSVDKRAKGANEKAHTRSLTKTIDPAKKSSVSNQSKETTKSKDGEKTKERPKDSRKDREKSRERTKHKTDDSKKTKDKSSKLKEDVQIDDEMKVEPMMDRGINDSNNNVENNVISELQLNEVPSTSTMMNGESQEKEELRENETTDSTSDKLVQEKNRRPPSSRSARPPSARNKRTKPIENSSSAIGASREPLMATSSAIMGNVPSVPEPDFESLPLQRPPSARPPSARPSSSRPAPPRIRIRHVVENEEPSKEKGTVNLKKGKIL